MRGLQLTKSLHFKCRISCSFYRFFEASLATALDFMNPAPDMDINSLTPFYFEWVVKAMADMAIEYATNPPKQRSELRWSRFLG